MAGSDRNGEDEEGQSMPAPHRLFSGQASAKHGLPAWTVERLKKSLPSSEESAF
jgi:hypothetical protein